MKRLNLDRQFVMKGLLLLAMISQISMDRVGSAFTASVAENAAGGKSSSMDLASTKPAESPDFAGQVRRWVGLGPQPAETAQWYPVIESGSMELSSIDCPAAKERERENERTYRTACEEHVANAKKVNVGAESCTVKTGESATEKDARVKKCAADSKVKTEALSLNAASDFIDSRKDCPVKPTARVGAATITESPQRKTDREACEKKRDAGQEQVKIVKSLIEAQQKKLEAAKTDPDCVGCNEAAKALADASAEEVKTLKAKVALVEEQLAKANAEKEAKGATGAGGAQTAVVAEPKAETEAEKQDRLKKEEEAKLKAETDAKEAKRVHDLKVFQCEIDSKGNQLGDRGKADCALSQIKKLGSYNYNEKDKAQKKTLQLEDLRLFQGILKGYLKEQLKSNDAGTRESAKAMLTSSKSAIETVASSQDLTRTATEKMVREFEGMETGAEVFAAAQAMKDETSDLRTRLKEAQTEVRAACKQSADSFYSIRINQSRNQECMMAVRELQGISVERATAQSALLQDLTYGTYAQTLAEMRKGGLTRAEFKEWTQPYLSLSKDLGLSDSAYGRSGINSGIADGLLSASMNSRLSDFGDLPGDFSRFRGIGNEYSYDRAGNMNLTGLRRSAFDNPFDSNFDRFGDGRNGSRFGDNRNNFNNRGFDNRNTNGNNMNGSIMNRGLRSNNRSNSNGFNNNGFNNSGFNNRFNRNTTFDNGSALRGTQFNNNTGFGSGQTFPNSNNGNNGNRFRN